MKQFISAILVSGVAFGMTACQKNENNDVKKDTVQNKFEFQKPSPGVRLTKIEARKIKAGLTIQSSMSLPPAHLIFPNTDTPEWQIAWEEQMLKNNDPMSYKMLKEIQATCGKARPTLNLDATFPANGGSIENLRDGDHGKITGSAGLSSAGNNLCPLDASVSGGMNADIQKIDQKEKSGTASAGMSYNIKLETKNSTYARKLGVRGIELNSALSTIAIVKNMKSGSASIDFGYSGKLLTLNTDVPFEINVKAVGSTNDLDKGGQIEFIASMKLNYDGIAAELVVHGLQSNNSQITAEMYLNGYETTQEELEDLFGKNTLQRIQDKNIKVIQTLK